MTIAHSSSTICRIRLCPQLERDHAADSEKSHQETIINNSKVNMKCESPYSAKSTLDTESPTDDNEGLICKHNSPFSWLFCRPRNEKQKKSSSSEEEKSGSKFVLLSPYFKNELLDKLDFCIDEVKAMDNIDPKYVTGSLVILCKSLRRIYIDSQKQHIIKKNNNLKYAQNLENWEIAISSIQIFIDGLKESKTSLSTRGAIQKKEKGVAEKLASDTSIENEKTNPRISPTLTDKLLIHEGTYLSSKNKSGDLSSGVPYRTYQMPFHRSPYNYSKRTENEDSILMDINNRLQNASDLDWL
ncbi:hypothetical protein CAS74_003294 [Pichia kudriavzevii]|uniref:Uncharacterized protein n=2 Tax=Pichia kudriavzevii TaxID=4909 RepID=A0A099NZ05_PICKU|nr:hypothetical protein JL09_g3743 [Pichia kudriavzevii]OUT21179.1 hypothetical protein CAS74_003294 [Pichia kudriavzevii]